MLHNCRAILLDQGILYIYICIYVFLPPLAPAPNTWHPRYPWASTGLTRVYTLQPTHITLNQPLTNPSHTTKPWNIYVYMSTYAYIVVVLPTVVNTCFAYIIYISIGYDAPHAVVACSALCSLRKTSSLTDSARIHLDKGWEQSQERLVARVLTLRTRSNVPLSLALALLKVIFPSLAIPPDRLDTRPLDFRRCRRPGCQVPISLACRSLCSARLFVWPSPRVFCLVIYSHASPGRKAELRLGHTYTCLHSGCSLWHGARLQQL